MSLVFPNEIKLLIDKEISLATESIQIISAFCKISAIEKFEPIIRDCVREKRLLVRYRLSDILLGATDFDLYEYCQNNGWEMYIRLDMHAKTFVFDKQRCFLGSANVTKNGLNINGIGNFELATLFSLDEADYEKLQKIYETAVLMNNDLYNMMKNEVERGFSETSINEWSNEIRKMFDVKINTLFSYELPDKSFPNDYWNQSIDFLELEAGWTMEEAKYAFENSKPLIWLKNLLSENNDEMYFGEISANLHNALISDPRPYRKDVKIYLQNILSWIEVLEIQDILIDRPNYSQRIRRI